MSGTRFRILNAIDRVLAAAIVSLLVGTGLGFGGAVWWAPVLIGGLTAVLVIAWLSRVAVTGRWTFLRSPLAAIGALGLALAALQSVPLPNAVAERISPSARAAHSLGALPELVRADDPDAAFPEPVTSRTPTSLDRPATLRWLAGAAACLALFGVVSGFADRRDRLYLVWGCVVAVFLLNSAIALIQIVGQSEGMYGFIEPGKGPKWAPNLADALGAPGATALRPVGVGRPTPHAWALPQPDRTALSGTLMGGPGAHLALGSLGLPLALGLALQLMSPGGSRDRFWGRLAESGQGSLLVLLIVATIASAFLMGLLAGPALALVFAAGIAIVGVPSLVGTGVGLKGFILTMLTLLSLGGGVSLGNAWHTLFPTAIALPWVDLASARETWSAAAAIVRDFPLVGTGLGSFATIAPYYKTRDEASTTAMSSLIQWWVESGAVGVVLLGLAIVWGLLKLPRAIGRVGSADRGAGLRDGRGGGLLRDDLLHSLDRRAGGGRAGRQRRRGHGQSLARGRDGPLRRTWLGRPWHGIDRSMPDTTYLQIEEADTDATRVVELPGAAIRVGRGTLCEVRLTDPELAEVQCLLRRRGTTWHVQPIGPAGLVSLGGQAVDQLRPLPPDQPLQVGSSRLLLRHEGGDRFHRPIEVESGSQPPGDETPARSNAAVGPRRRRRRPSPSVASPDRASRALAPDAAGREEVGGALEGRGRGTAGEGPLAGGTPGRRRSRAD